MSAPRAWLLSCTLTCEHTRTLTRLFCGWRGEEAAEAGPWATGGPSPTDQLTRRPGPCGAPRPGEFQRSPWFPGLPVRSGLGRGCELLREGGRIVCPSTSAGHLEGSTAGSPAAWDHQGTRGYSRGRCWASRVQGFPWGPPTPPPAGLPALLPPCRPRAPPCPEVQRITVSPVVGPEKEEEGPWKARGRAEARLFRGGHQQGRGAGSVTAKEHGLLQKEAARQERAHQVALLTRPHLSSGAACARVTPSVSPSHLG